MITVSTFPESSPTNHYIRLFNRALERGGVVQGPPLVCQDAFLREQAGKVHALHVQWTPENLWRSWGWSSLWWKLRGVAGLWKYFRLAKALGMRVVCTLHDVEPHEGLERREMFGRLLQLLEELPERDRELISLKYGAGLTNRAIAKHLRLTETNVGTLLHRAVQKLRAGWPEEGAL